MALVAPTPITRSSASAEIKVRGSMPNPLEIAGMIVGALKRVPNPKAARELAG
jgi:hypothetical protein